LQTFAILKSEFYKFTRFIQVSEDLD